MLLNEPRDKKYYKIEHNMNLWLKCNACLKFKCVEYLREMKQVLEVIKYTVLP